MSDEELREWLDEVAERGERADAPADDALAETSIELLAKYRASACASRTSATTAATTGSAPAGTSPFGAGRERRAAGCARRPPGRARRRQVADARRYRRVPLGRHARHPPDGGGAAPAARVRPRGRGRRARPRAHDRRDRHERRRDRGRHAPAEPAEHARDPDDGRGRVDGPVHRADVAAVQRDQEAPRTSRSCGRTTSTTASTGSVYRTDALRRAESVVTTCCASARRTTS